MKNLLMKTAGISVALLMNVSLVYADECQDAVDDYNQSSIECRAGLSPAACISCWADAGRIYANCKDITLEDYDILLSGCYE